MLGSDLHKFMRLSCKERLLLGVATFALAAAIIALILASIRRIAVFLGEINSETSLCEIPYVDALAAKQGGPKKFLPDALRGSAIDLFCPQLQSGC